VYVVCRISINATRFYSIVINKILGSSRADNSRYIQKWRLLDFTNKMIKREFTARLFSSFCNSSRNRPRSGMPFDLHRPLDDVYSESRSRILGNPRKEEQLVEIWETNATRMDQLEAGFRLMKNISPADYTDFKFISWRISSRVCWKLWNHTNAKWRCSII